MCKAALAKEALHHAARNGVSQEAVELLLRNGAPVNYAGKEHGETPMYAAAATGNTDVAETLLRYGADLECRCREGGRTPLLVAAQYGHADMVTWLLCMGADADARTTIDFRPLSGECIVPAGSSALDMARLFHWEQVADLIETGTWRNGRRSAFASLRELREQGRCYLKTPEEMEEEEVRCNSPMPWEVPASRPSTSHEMYHEALCIDRLLTLAHEVGPYTSDGIVKRVFEFADW